MANQNEKKYLAGLMVVTCLQILSGVPSTLADFGNLESYSPFYGLAVISKNMNSERSDCLQKLSRIEEAISQKDVWALKLMDASGMAKSGFFWGNNYWLGSRSQCITAHSGKEPMINYDLPPVTRETKETVVPFPVDYYVAYFYHNSTMQTIIRWPNETKISLGLCLPSSCTKDEVYDLLQKYFDMGGFIHQKLFNASFSLDTIKKTEYKSEPEHPISVTLLIWTIIALTGCAFGTLYDVFVYQKGLFQTNANGKENGPNKTPADVATWQKILLSFSWYSNIKTIFTTEVKKDSLVPVMGLRFFLTTFIIFIHANLFLIDYYENRTALYMFEPNWLTPIFQNSSYGVDTFFMMGGFLTIYSLSKSKDLKDNVQHTNWGLLKIFLRSVFKRFRRLTPVYMFVMMMTFNLTLFRDKLCSFWTNERNDVQCAQYWWTNLLYINNVYPGTFDSMCMSWSWYLACDMQFFVITSFIYILSKKFSKAATAFALAISIGSFAALGVTVYLTGLRLYPELFYELAPSVYYPPWARINCYLVGAIYAYLFVKLNGKCDMKKIYIRLNWIISVGVCLYLVYGFEDKNLSTVAAVVHATFHRATFTVASGWMLFACLTGHGGVLNTVLCLKGWRPFAHLSYVAYLMNPYIMYAVATEPEGSWQFSPGPVTVTSSGLVMITYVQSFVLVLLIEMPFDKLLNIMFGDRPRSSREIKQLSNDKQTLTEGAATVVSDKASY